MYIEHDRVVSVVRAALAKTLFVLGPCIRNAAFSYPPQTRLHTLGLQNIFLATSLVGIIQSILGESVAIEPDLEERIAHDPTMTIGDLAKNISNTNP